MTKQNLEDSLPEQYLTEITRYWRQFSELNQPDNAQLSDPEVWLKLFVQLIFRKIRFSNSFHFQWLMVIENAGTSLYRISARY